MECRDALNLAKDSSEVYSSASSKTSRRLLPVPSNSNTYVPMTVEELSLVQDLSSWMSTNVRCIGHLVDTDSGVILQSCSDVAGEFEINVNLSLMEREPPRHTVIQLFGEICIDENKVPIIVGCFYRNFESVNLVMYNQALDMISSLFPLNIHRNADQSSCKEKHRKDSDLPNR